MKPGAQPALSALQPGPTTGRRWIIAGDWKDRNDRITDILQDVTFAANDARDDQIEEGI